MALALQQRIGLSRPQFRLLTDPARFRVAAAGRRGGKTFEALTELWISAANFPRSLNWYIAPTRVAAKDIAWQDLANIIPAQAIREKSEGELWVQLVNGSRIALKGAENADKTLRGRGVRKAVCDEYRDMDANVWPALRPCLSDISCEGSCLFIGSPRVGHFKELWSRASEGRPGWSAHHWTSLEGGNISAEELVQAAQDLSPRDYRQEYEATWESAQGRIYHAFQREFWPEGNLGDVKDAGGQVLVGMDFNVNPMTATLSSEVARSDGDGGEISECHTWGEILLRDAGTAQMCAEIRRRFPDREIMCYPDPTGNARSTTSGARVTDFSIIRSFGFGLYAPRGGYPISTKLNTTNGMLHNSLGVRRLIISPTECPNLVNAYDGYCYRDDSGEFDKRHGFDHPTDAQGYMLCGRFPMRSSSGIQSYYVGADA